MALIGRKVPNLASSTRYIARVRAVNPFGVRSDWSEAIDFVTQGDAGIPNAPTALLTSFITPELVISWTAPTANTNGSPLLDFAYYQVTLIGDSVTKQYATSSTYFNLPLAMNMSDFGGDSQFDIEVRAVDTSGHLSAPLLGSATKSTLPNPTLAPVLSPAFTIIGIYMPPPVGGESVGGRRLQHSTDGVAWGDLAYPTGDTYSHTVTFGSTHYYRYKYTDGFGNESAAWSPVASTTTLGDPTAPDLTPPADPTGLAGTPGIDAQTQHPYINVTWNASAAPDLASYEIRIRKQGDVVFRSVMKGPNILEHRFVDLHSGKNYDLQMRAVDTSGNYTPWVPGSPLVVTTGTGTVAYDPAASGSLVVSSTGQIVSSDFSPGIDGWRLSAGGLEINEGAIYAPALRIGVSSENHVVNSSFENGTVVATGWSAYTNGGTSTYSVTAGQFKYQSKSQRMTMTGSGGVQNGLYQDVTFPRSMPAGTPVAVSYWVRLASGGARQAGIFITPTGTSAGPLHTSATVSTGSSADWVRVTTTWTLDIARTGVRIHLVVNTVGSAQVFEFDGAQLELSSFVTEYKPATLEIPDNYIQSAYISGLTADKFQTGTMSAATISMSGTGYIQSLGYTPTGTPQGYRLSASGLTMQDASVSIVSVAGGVTMDGTQFKLDYAASTKFKVDQTGVYIGGSTTGTASVYFNTTTGATVFQDTSGTFKFVIDTAQAQNKVLRFTSNVADVTDASDRFYLKKDGSVYFSGAVAGGTIDIGGADSTSFHVDVNGNMWLGNALLASAPFKVDSLGNLTAASISGANTINNSTSNYLQSSTYVAGTSGWRITGAGDVEFNAGVFRGSLEASSLKALVASSAVLNTNPDFTTNTTGWTADSGTTITRIITDGLADSFSLGIRRTTTTGYPGVTGANFAVVAGRWYRLSYAIKFLLDTVTNGVGVKFSIEFLDAGANVLTITDKFGDPAVKDYLLHSAINTWYQTPPYITISESYVGSPMSPAYNFVARAPVGAVNARIRIAATNDAVTPWATTDSVRVDQVRVTEVGAILGPVANLTTLQVGETGDAVTIDQGRITLPIRDDGISGIAWTEQGGYGAKTFAYISANTEDGDNLIIHANTYVGISSFSGMELFSSSGTINLQNTTGAITLNAVANSVMMYGISGSTVGLNNVGDPVMSAASGKWLYMDVDSGQILFRRAAGATAMFTMTNGFNISYQDLVVNLSTKFQLHSYGANHYIQYHTNPWAQAGNWTYIHGTQTMIGDANNWRIGLNGSTLVLNTGSGGGTTWVTPGFGVIQVFSSTREVKRNINDMSALLDVKDFFQKVQPRVYARKDMCSIHNDIDDYDEECPWCNMPEFGLVAEELIEITPWLGKKEVGSTKYFMGQAIDEPTEHTVLFDTQLHSIAIAGVKTAMEEIDELRQQIEDLKAIVQGLVD